MDWGRVIFIFFVLMSLTSIVGFLFNTNVILLFIATAISFISTTLMIGTKRILSSELFASFIVADFHLVPAFIFYQVLGDLDIAYALAFGAFIANSFAIVMVIIYSIKTRSMDY